MKKARGTYPAPFWSELASDHHDVTPPDFLRTLLRWNRPESDDVAAALLLNLPNENLLTVVRPWR